MAASTKTGAPFSRNDSYDAVQDDNIYGDDIDDEGSMMEDDEGDEASTNRENPEAGHQRDRADQGPSHPTVFGDIGVFRDFFLAAFSDGYYNVRPYHLHWLLVSLSS